ncbi:MAG TPA: HAD family hydrolase [Myxococcota bacterium]|nr:HAD family hydrolase [Myxococcota bacterium]
MARPRRRVRPRVGAFFDMDKTLIAENSGALFMRYRYEQGRLSGWELALGLVAYLRYKAGILDIRAWTADAMEQFAGESERALTREAQAWFDQWVAPTIYPEAVELVRHHTEAGHVVVIVSGATKYVVKPLAARLGVKHILYTRLEVERGRFTGRVIDPICFEEGKIYWLQQLVDEQRIDLAKSWFYTDSVTDLPLLELVGHPVVVNPDPRLYRVAARRHWPVRFFTPPERPRLPPPRLEDLADPVTVAERDAV